MESGLQPGIEFLREIWPRRWIGAAVAWAVALTAAAIVLRVPDRFESQARVYVDAQALMPAQQPGPSAHPEAYPMAHLLADSLLTRSNIEQLVATAALQGGGTSPQAREALIERLMQSIRVAPADGKNFYDISYRDMDPGTSLRVVEALVGLFGPSAAGDRRVGNLTGHRLVDEQIAVATGRLQEAEGRLDTFKQRNLGIAGGAGAPDGMESFNQVAVVQQELVQVRADLGAAERARDALKQAPEGASTTASDATGAAAPGDARAPTRVQLRGASTQKRSRVAASSRESAGDAALAAPAASHLADAEATVATLRARASELSARLGELRGAVGQGPQVDAELSQLNQEVEAARKSHDELVQRRDAALAAGQAGAAQSQADFRLVDPPHLNPHAVFPGRSTLVPLALLLALASGVGASFVLNRLVPVVQGARDLCAVTSRPVLGSVSTLPTAEAISHERRRNVSFLAAVSALVVAYGAWTVAVALGIVP